MTPDAVAQIAEALKRARGRLTPDERRQLTAEVNQLRRLQESVKAESEILHRDAASADAQRQLAGRVVSFYQRLGDVERLIDRLRHH